MLLALFSLDANAFSVEQTGKRSSPSHDMFRRFHQHFPDVKGQDVSKRCDRLTRDNQTFLGEISPADGTPTFEQVSPAFMSWYYTCIAEYFDKEESNSEFLKGDANLFLGVEGTKALLDMRTAAGMPKSVPLWYVAKLASWESLSEDVQVVIMRHLLYTFIGPGIVDDGPFMQDVFVNVIGKDAKISVRTAVFKMIVSVMSQDQYLEY